MDEGDNIFLYSGSYFDCYHYVCSNNYCSRWQQTRFRLSNFLRWEGVYALYNIWCFVSTFFLNFIVDVSWRSHSRYVEEDFLRSLPIKMMIGLSTLILSIATMMITFVLLFSLFYQENHEWSFLSFVLLV